MIIDDYLKSINIRVFEDDQYIHQVSSEISKHFEMDIKINKLEDPNSGKEYERSECLIFDISSKLPLINRQRWYYLKFDNGESFKINIGTKSNTNTVRLPMHFIRKLKKMPLISSEFLKHVPELNVIA